MEAIRKVLVVGGANGIGLSIATELAKRESVETVYIIDKNPIAKECLNKKFKPFTFDLKEDDYSIFDNFNDIDTLMITAGFGKLQLFRDIEEEQIKNYFDINTIPTLRIIKHFYSKLESSSCFRCGVMVSIAGFMSSPFFSVYAATKAALKVFIESVNVELVKAGSTNRIMNISPGSIKGTSFTNAKTDLSITAPLAKEIISHLENGDDLFIPKYNEVFREVLERYHNDFRAEGIHSYEYKVNSGRASAEKKA